MDGGITWWPEDSEAELEYRYRCETVIELRPRWQALWLLRQGYSRKAVALAVDINLRTLRDWIAWYQTGGCAEVARHRHGGRQGHPCRMTGEQEAELAEWAANGLFYTIENARPWVADTWHVQYTYDEIRSVLDRLGIHPRVPRPLAAQANLTEQEAWKKEGCARRSTHKKRLGPCVWAGATSFASVLRARGAEYSHRRG